MLDDVGAAHFAGERVDLGDGGVGHHDVEVRYAVFLAQLLHGEEWARLRLRVVRRHDQGAALPLREVAERERGCVRGVTICGYDGLEDFPLLALEQWDRGRGSRGLTWFSSARNRCTVARPRPRLAPVMRTMV